MTFEPTISTKLFDFVNECNFSDEDLVIIEEFIDQGADPNFYHEEEEESIVSIIMDGWGRKKKKTKALKLLFSKGVKVEEYKGLDSFLYYAANVGEIDFLNELLENGIRVGIQEAFRVAVQKDNLTMAKMILATGFDVKDHGMTAINTEKKPYLEECCEANRVIDAKEGEPIPGVEMATLLLENGADPQRGFMTAVAHGFIELVELLVTYGVNPKEQPVAMFNAYTVPMFELLAKHGADINARWNDNATPLIRSVVQSGDEKVLTYLLKNSDLYAVDDRGYTAFHIAALYGKVKRLQFLLNYYDIHKCEAIKPLIDESHEDQTNTLREYLQKKLS